ncbi:MAG: rhomboid family intramembrane serine protease [Proteobacteria bacterium]|nr:rhomboid family intramembrane serine protease [Pseudomonadota bacterium]
MADVTQRFAEALAPVMSAANGWVREATDLVEEAPLFSQGRRAAVLLVPADETSSPQVRALLDQIVRRAVMPPTPRNPKRAVPWEQLVVAMVFEGEASPSLRAFIESCRKALSSKQNIRFAWVDLAQADVGFHAQGTPFDTDLMARLKDAATRFHASARRSDSSRSRPATEGRIPWGTAALASACAATTLYIGFDRFLALRYGALQVNLADQGQRFRFLSAVFAQSSAAESAVAAVGLVTLGAALERVYGTITFLALFCVCALASTVTTHAYGCSDIYLGLIETLCGFAGATAVAAVRYPKADLWPSLYVRTGLVVVAGFSALSTFAQVGSSSFFLLNARHPREALFAGLAAGVLFAVLVPAPRPQPSKAWKTMSPALMALAAAPFVGLGMAVWLAGWGASHVVFKDARGFSVKGAAHTVMVKGTDGPIFMGASYNIHVGVQATPRPDADAEIETFRAEIEHDLEKRGMIIKSASIASQGPRRWLVVRARQSDKSEREYGYTIDGSTLYAVTMWGPSLDAGMDAFRSVLRSFSVTPATRSGSSSKTSRSTA